MESVEAMAFESLVSVEAMTSMESMEFTEVV
jgi:hypothetical protein